MVQRNQGGKGFPNVIYVLWVHFVCYTINAAFEMNKKYSFFARFYFGQSLRKMGLMKLTHTLPYSDKMPFLYRKTMSFIVQNNLCEKMQGNWSAKELIKKKEISGKLCRVGLLNDSASETIWKNVNYSRLNNRQKDLAWLSVHGRLPCKEHLYKKHMVKSDKCVKNGCTAAETIQHVFFECVYAKECWKRVTRLSKKFIRDQDMCVNLILYGPKKGIKTNASEKGWIIINCVKEALWIVRNRNVYNLKIETTVNDFCKIVIVKIRDYVWLDMVALGKAVALKKWKINSLGDLFF